MQAHRRWHYRRDGQPAQFVRWFARFRFEPIPATMQNLAIRAWCVLTCREMPWEVEAREEEEEAAEKLEHAKHHPLALASPHSTVADGELDSHPPLDGAQTPLSHRPSGEAAAGGGSSSGAGELAMPDDASELSEDASDGSEEEREEEEAEDIFFKRAMAGMGMAAVYLSWVRSCFSLSALRPHNSLPTPGHVHLVHLCGAFAARAWFCPPARN